MISSLKTRYFRLRSPYESDLRISLTETMEKIVRIKPEKQQNPHIID